MGYLPISIREAMEKISKSDWVLPVTQRPYVWGDRYQFEKGINRLFDSLYRNYPIGTFLLWDTEENVPYREFIQHFDPESPLARPQDQSAWSRPKCLIYDGQQRLQSLYSCLKYTFCDRVLCFDLLFEPISENIDKSGFHFVDRNTNIEPHQLSLKTLFEDYRREGSDGLTEFRRRITKSLGSLNDDQITIIQKNIDKLWKLFNDRTNQVCGYFTIPNELSGTDVQEIFVRLNTGGVQPTQADLVFSMIHVQNYDFQSRVQDIVDEIWSTTRIDLTIYDVLQILYFIQYQNPRIDLDRVRKREASDLTQLLNSAEQTLKAFYKRFLHDEFMINSSSLYRSQIALLPLLFYYHVNNIKDIPSGKELVSVKQYFILSQLNDWSLQSILLGAAKLMEKNKPEFPLEGIVTIVKTTTRSALLTEQSLLSMPNFSLKLLLPKKVYTFIENRGRLNPELEHIFPRNPREIDLPGGYDEGKWKLWNLQLAVPGDINMQKLNAMPQTFFTKRADALHHYDFLPSSNITALEWDYHSVNEFWEKRRELMIKKLWDLYQLKVCTGGDSPVAR